jgi:glycine oxidase
VKVLVVGAGVIGAALADELASRGATVTVLDMRSPGRGASQASAGVLAPYIEARDTPLLQLASRSLGLYDEFVARASDRSGESIEYARTGTLEIALTDDDAERLKAAKTWLDGNRVANEWLESSELRSFEPTATSTATAGLLISQHGFVGVGSLVGALVQSARLRGAWFESPVEVAHVEPHIDRVDVRAGDRHYSADHVVIATGSWSRRVHVTGVPELPVRPLRGQLVHLRWPAAAERPSRVVWGPRCYTVPWSDGSLLVGATVEDVGFDEGTTVAGVRDLMDAVGELLPKSWQASIEGVRVGLRPATPDGLPAIGPFRGVPRVSAATGHYRNGILLAPLTAEIVATYLLDGASDPALLLTTPTRFVPYNGAL